MRTLAGRPLQCLPITRFWVINGRGKYPELLSPPARTHSGQPESYVAKALLLTSSRGREQMAKPCPFYEELSSASDVSLPDWL
jgi:hypothetical protein